jgi:predicted ATP-binding protein involved in virulence
LLRIRHVSVSNLFGMFDHNVELRDEERITIIHAPNGHGKTVLLKLIHALFDGSLALFRKYEFDSFKLQFDTGTEVRITQRSLDRNDDDALFQNNLRHRTYSIEYDDGTEVHKHDPLENFSGAGLARRIPSSVLERFTPLSYLGQGQFREPTGDILSIEEGVERYYHQLPNQFQRNNSTPEWLNNLRESISCQLVETQRLLISNAEHRRGPDRDNQFVPSVSIYASNLQSKISRTLAEAATLSQSLDRSFPNRLITRMREIGQFQDDNYVRDRLNELEKKRERLAEVDLSDPSDPVSLLSDEKFEESTLRIFTEYITDAEKKLSVYNILLPKLELFAELINKRFFFKTMRISREKGFVFSDRNGRPLSVDSLSSGEQHELVLFYRLIFETTDRSLFLIDEPEISLHIAWQKKFLDDLKRIIDISPFDVVISTHSPQLIGGNLDLLEELSGPIDE